MGWFQGRAPPRAVEGFWEARSIHPRNQISNFEPGQPERDPHQIHGPRSGEDRPVCPGLHGRVYLGPQPRTRDPTIPRFSHEAGLGGGVVPAEHPGSKTIGDVLLGVLAQSIRGIGDQRPDGIGGHLVEEFQRIAVDDCDLHSSPLSGVTSTRSMTIGIIGPVAAFNSGRRLYPRPRPMFSSRKISARMSPSTMAIW